MTRAPIRILTVILLAGALFSQSLVDVSKAEKERREKLKGKNVKVITNEDLKSVRRTPAVETREPGQSPSEPGAGEPVPKPEEQGAPEAAAEFVPSFSQEENPYATRVLPDTTLVEQPENALNFPDGRYAEISMLGLLELEFRARNGPGPDIAVYSRLSGLDEALAEAGKDGVPIDATTYQYWEGFWYGVLGLGESGDWEVIGQGTGRSSPERFDLGRLKSITRLRIIFKPHNNPDLPVKLYRGHEGEFRFGIDAVEALH